MGRAFQLACCLAVFACGCTPAQAPALRTSGKLMAIGGVAGIVGSAFAIRLSDHANEMLVGFEVISAVGVGTYAYAELTFPPSKYIPETVTEKHRRWAKTLTERASGAAREGRCARVRRLEPRIHAYDREVHDFVFMRDPEIVRCLGSTPPTETAPSEPAENLSEPALITPHEAEQAP
jgi:hypothetical protein